LRLPHHLRDGRVTHAHLLRQLRSNVTRTDRALVGAHVPQARREHLDLLQSTWSLRNLIAGFNELAQQHEDNSSAV
jgi:hypothetical protein